MFDPATVTPFRDPLENLVKQEITQDTDREKIVQYAMARRNWLYYRGKQYLYPVMGDGGQIADWSTIPGQLLAGGDKGTGLSRAYDYVINEYRGLVDKAIAILAQKAPGLKAQADRRDDDAASRRARKADIIAGVFRSNWDIDTIIQDLALCLLIDGTTFLHTPYVANAQKYGSTTTPIVELQDKPAGEPYFECSNCGARPSVTDVQETGTCPECGAPLSPEDMREPDTMPMPTVTGEQQDANGSVECHVCDITTVSTPFYIKSLDDTPWLRWERELHKSLILATHPYLREWMRNEPAFAQDLDPTVSVARLTRDLESSPSATTVPPRKGRWTYTEYWVTPGLIDSGISDTADPTGAIRKQLLAQCPNGAKLIFVNNKLIAPPQPAQLTEEWVAVKPRPSKYIYADALAEDFIGTQDIINDFHNTMKEMADRNIPVTIYDPRAIDPATFKQHRATPMEFMPALPTAGGSLRELMWTTETVKLEPQVIGWVGSMLDRGRDIMGVNPAASGGESGVEKTARQAEMDRNQALLQLGLPWNQIRRGLSIAFENGVVQLAKNGNGKLVQKRSGSLGPTEIDMPDMADVIEGGWHFKAEEAMPMTWGQRRDTWRELMDSSAQNQILAGVIGLDDPENAQIAQEALGMADWKVPMLDSLYKAHDVIRQLSQGVPTTAPDPMTGLPKVMPSVPVDEFEDDHNFMARVVREWAQTEKARELRETNPDGYANVIAWGKAHFDMTQPPPMPPGGPGGPGGPPPPGGGPPGPGGPEPPPGAPPAPEGGPEAAPPPPQQPTGAPPPAGPPQ
jgi:hypothetical protein